MKQNTISLLIGPSNCGKSTFAQRIKMEAESNSNSCVVISSDEIRRELLCSPHESKMSASMMAVSGEAFRLLNMRVDFHSSFPINTQQIVVDSTGLSEEFRNEMITIAEKNHYNIEAFVFDYSRSDLENMVKLSGDGDQFVSGRHQKKLREEVLPNLNRKAYSSVKIFKNPQEVTDYAIEFSGPYHSNVCINETEKIAVIGDVHECVDELKNLINTLPSDIKHLVFLGDIFDKGGKTKETLEYIFELSNRLVEIGVKVYFIKGNHERYVYKRLKGMIQPNLDLENNFFQSFRVLEQDENLKQIFFSLFETMKETIFFERGREKSIVVTHAPCSNIYLNKTDSVSQGKQVNFYFKNRGSEEMMKELEFISNEANFNHAWHLFGHVAHNGRRPYQIKNKVFMDTGCVHGGKLSAAVFNGRWMDFYTVDSTRENDGGMITLEKNETKLDKILRSEIRLSDEDERAVRRVIKGGAKFVSGTVAPAPAKGQDIESLEAGLEFFKEHDQVILQPKYMGSRCQFYLNKDRSKNFAVSRNGFRINIHGIEDCMNAYQDWIQNKLGWDDELILDGELLPWAALGKGLIAGGFYQYYEAAQIVMGELATDDVFGNFDIASTINPTEKLADLEKFKTQLDLYGSEKPMEFRPFSVLSIDGQVVNDNTWFSFVNEEKEAAPIVIDPKTGLDKATKYFNKLAFEYGFEGIMIKPIKHDGKTPPYMKVRNKEYLRLVYGFDYNSRLEELCKQKSIKRKLAQSMDEYEVGMAMLASDTDQQRNHLIASMFGCISKGKDIDPRL